LASRLLDLENEGLIPRGKFDASGLKPEVWASILFNSADSMYYLPDFERAIRLADHVIELSSRHATAFVLRGAAHANLRHRGDASRDFERAIQLDPNNHLAFFNRGFFSYWDDLHEDAIRDLSRAAEFDPGDWISFAWRGEAHLDLGEIDLALADFDKALQLKPDTAWILASRGRGLARQGRVEEALADFDRAIQIDPTEAAALANRAGIFRLYGRLGDALASVDRAIQASPSFAWAIGIRGEVYRAMGDYDRALANFDRAFEISPDQWWWAGVRGLTLMLVDGDYDEARAALQTAVIGSRTPPPQFAYARAWLLLASAVCHALLGEQQQVRECWELARLTPDYALASLVYAAGLAEIRDALTITEVGILLDLLMTEMD
jgi:tetratricopeptide (TPR) repeat protein